MVHLLGQRRTRFIILSAILVLWVALLLLLFGNELGKLHGVLLKPLLEISVPQHPETYNDSTLPIFPAVGETEISSESDLCSNFPLEWLEKVQVILKTGVGQQDKNEAHLSSVTSCFQNIIVFSDVAERIQDREFIDILEELPESYLQHPDFGAYQKQRTAYDSGEPIGLSNEGWKLDRFKFLPMINEAYEMRPNASWYVFLEADVYMFWDNLFRFLDQFNGQEMHYFGSATTGSHGRWFAYGGAGIVLSQGLMKGLVGDGTLLSEKYQDWMLADCCGDAVLGYVILDKTGVKVEDLFPMFSGDSLEDLGISEHRWCNPLLSLHRMTANSLRSLWHWERTRRVQKV
jgi:hypothetical protein